MLEQVRQWAKSLDVATALGDSPIVEPLRERLESLEEFPRSASRDGTRAILLSRLAGATRLLGKPKQAFEQALEAESLANSAQDAEAIAYAQQALGQVLFHVGQLEEAHRRLTLAANSAAAPSLLRLRSRMNAASVLRAMGRLEDATTAFDQLVQEIAEHPAASWASVLINAASTWHQVGRTADARVALDRARAQLSSVNRPDLMVWASVIGAWVAAAEGQLDEARDLALAALTANTGVEIAARSSAARVLGDAAVKLGGAHLDEAREHLEALIPQTQAEHFRQEALDLHGTLATLAEESGDLVTAVHHLREARRITMELATDRDQLRLQQEEMRLELARMQIEADALRSGRAELARANQALAESDAAREKLLHALVHDLRGPLTSMTILVELLERRDAPDFDARRHQLVQTVHRLSDLIDQAVQSAGHTVQSEVDVVELIRESTLAFQALAERKQQQLLVQTGAPVTTRTNAEAVRRITDNLVSNALKFSPPGSTVRVGVDSSDSAVELTVKDDGPGFPNIEAENGLLFGTKLTARSTANEPSLGIGLHTVYSLATQLGGVVAVGNHPGGGAMVRVKLPA